MQALAAYAEQHIDDTEAPLFLRFINLLINDAIFLLDEALSVNIVHKLSVTVWLHLALLIVIIVTVTTNTTLFLKKNVPLSRSL